MVGKEYLLNSIQMAQFVARGFLRFDELIPKEINEAIMKRHRRRNGQGAGRRDAALAVLSTAVRSGRDAAPAASGGYHSKPGRR